METVEELFEALSSRHNWKRFKNITEQQPWKYLLHLSGGASFFFFFFLSILHLVQLLFAFIKLGGMPPNLFLSCDFFPLSFFLSFFLLSSFSQFASSPTCLTRFRPNLVTMTSRSVATKVINSLTSKVMKGSQGSKRLTTWKIWKQLQFKN